MSPIPRPEHHCEAAPAFTVLTGDARTVLPTLGAASVDCVVTSPPYWRLRDYHTGTWTGGNPACPHPPGPPGHDATCPTCGAYWHDDQIGQEDTLDEYLTHLVEVFTHLRRVLTPTGTCWVVIADSYATNSDGYHVRTGRPGQPHYRPRTGLANKNLLGLPWRVAYALHDHGWHFADAIIWHKPNAAPWPITDRLDCRHEIIFRLAPCRSAGQEGPVGSEAVGVWTLPAVRGRGAGRAAAFPVEVPLRCLRATAVDNRPMRVLDPFHGTGTTHQAALRLGHAYVGIDLRESARGAASLAASPGGDDPAPMKGETGVSYPSQLKPRQGDLERTLQARAARRDSSRGSI